MSKYIKLEDAIEAYNQAVTNLVESEMEEFDLGDFTECQFNTTQIKLIARMIASLPTIDIVNCIECVYRGDDWWCYKHEFTPIPIEDYFCKDGERKDNE